MGFQCTTAAELSSLSPKRCIQKYPVNYQPSVKLKRVLKNRSTTYKEGSKNNWLALPKT